MRSSIEQNAWPPILTGRAATIMAMQHYLSKSQWWSADRLRDEQAITLPYKAAIDHPLQDGGIFGLQQVL